MKIPVFTNSNGNSAYVIIPSRPLGAAASYTDSFALRLSDSTFNPSTGSQTPNAIFIAGPLAAQTAAIESYRVSTFSVCFYPILAAINN